MDFGGLVVLGIVWMLFNLLGSGKGKTRSTPRSGPPTPRPRPQPGPAAGGPGDPSQREGGRLEQLLRELERNLEGAAGTLPSSGSRLPTAQGPASARLPAPIEGEEEDVEDRESLEEAPRVVSLETEVQRPRRVAYDHDTGADAIVRHRIEAARGRDGALSKADHKAFDARIRQEPTDHTAVRRYTPEQLRDAIVWREILGPPVSERG